MSWETTALPFDDPALDDRWQALWANSPQRSPFSSLAYARAIAAATGLTGTAFLTARSGQDEAGVLVFGRRRGPYREATVPFYTPFTPLVLRTLPDEASLHVRTSAFDALLPALEARYDVLRLHLDPSMTDVRALQWRGWKASPLYTYCTPLTDEATLLAGWSSGTRRTFRTARTDYHVAEAPEAVPAIVALCAESYARQQRELPLGAARLTPLVERLGAHGLVRCFTATPTTGGVPEAGIAVLHDGQTACYWIAGSQPGAAMTVLLGTLLPQLHTEGLARFDFIGANTPSIAEFKRRFSPRLTPYYRVEHVTRPELRLWLALRGQ
jgi:hypothetical protein